VLKNYVNDFQQGIKKNIWFIFGVMNRIVSPINEFFGYNIFS
jgi:hypothetical protein